LIVKITERPEHSILEVEERGHVTLLVLKSEWQIHRFLTEKGASDIQIDEALQRLKSSADHKATIFLPWPMVNQRLRAQIRYFGGIILVIIIALMMVYAIKHGMPWPYRPLGLRSTPQFDLVFHGNYHALKARSEDGSVVRPEHFDIT
jgi:hypothetical protein